MLAFDVGQLLEPGIGIDNLDPVDDPVATSKNTGALGDGVALHRKWRRLNKNRKDDWTAQPYTDAVAVVSKDFWETEATSLGETHRTSSS